MHLRIPFHPFPPCRQDALKQDRPTWQWKSLGIPWGLVWCFCWLLNPRASFCWTSPWTKMRHLAISGDLRRCFGIASLWNGLDMPRLDPTGDNHLCHWRTWLQGWSSTPNVQDLGTKHNPCLIWFKEQVFDPSTRIYPKKRWYNDIYSLHLFTIAI